ncbi:MAG: pyridoxal phosphate-dependent aminotransferase [Candidatus Micrarchaeota archaeon]
MFRKHLAKKDGTPLHYFETLAPAPKLALDLTTLPLIPEMEMRFGLDNFQHYSRAVDEGLVRAISEFEGVGADSIAVVSGADMGLEIAMSHLLDPGDEAGVMTPAFPRFGQIATELCGARVKTFESIHELPEATVIVINTPNNPSTKAVARGKIETAIESRPGSFFIIDGVFSAFGQRGLASLAEEFPNAVFINSVSKSHGLAGLRVGWIISRNKNLAQFGRGVSKFHVPLPNQKIAASALGEEEFVERARGFIDTEFSFLKKEIRAPLVRETPVPFYLAKVSDSKAVQKRLMKLGISVVDCSTFPGMGNKHIRVRIGNRAENEMFAEEFNSNL